MSAKLCHLAIKIPSSNDKDEHAMEQFFNSIHKVYPRNIPLSLEIISQGHFLTYYITSLAQYKVVFESQLYSYYQDIEVQEKDDWLANINDYYCAELRFKHNNFFPITTFHHIKDDILKNISTFVARVDDEESFFMQLVLKPLGSHSYERGLRAVYFDLTGTKATKAGTETAKAYKYKQNLFAGSLRIGFASPDTQSARAKLNVIANLFEILKNNSNKLSLKGLSATSDIRDRTLSSYNYWMPAEIATVYHFPYQEAAMSSVVQTTSRKAPAPDVLPKSSDPDQKSISLFGATNYRNEKQVFGIKRSDRRRHLYIVGKTGSGKSKLMELLAIDDIKAGEGCCFLDPHGDSAQEILKFVPKNRVKDVIYVDPADQEYPIPFNALEYTGDYEERQRIARFFIAIFKKIFHRDWNERMEHVLRFIILALLETRDSNILGISRILTDTPYRQRVISNLTDPVVKAFWTNEFAGYNDQYSTQAIVPLQNKIGQFVANPVIRNMVGQQRNALDFEAFMNEGKIVIINLSKGKLGEDNVALLGSMFITKIQQAALARATLQEEKRRDFYFYIDEFQNFATEAFESILSEARKYRLNLTIAHQYIEQLPEELRSTVFGNIGSLIIFSVGGRDSEYLAKEFAPTFKPEDMINLEAREMYIRMLVDGRIIKPFSGRTLDIKVPNEDYTVDILSQVHLHYGRNRLEVETEIKKWTETGDAVVFSGKKTDYPDPIL